MSDRGNDNIVGIGIGYGRRDIICEADALDWSGDWVLGLLGVVGLAPATRNHIGLLGVGCHPRDTSSGHGHGGWLDISAVLAIVEIKSAVVAVRSGHRHAVRWRRRGW